MPSGTGQDVRSDTYLLTKNYCLKKAFNLSIFRLLWCYNGQIGLIGAFSSEKQDANTVR